MQLDWINIGNNIWKANKSKIVHRLFLHDNEILNARNYRELSLRQPWLYKNKKLYYYSEVSPVNFIFSAPTRITMYLQNQSYINISKLDLQGGESSSIHIVGSSNISIENCNIGKHSSYGIYIINSKENKIVKNIIIKDSIFDSGFILDYSWVKPGGRGADFIGSNDGIFFGSGTQDLIIYNNYFKNWNHSSISFNTKSSYLIKNNEIFNNTLTAPDIDYGGRIGFSGNVTKNNIHHNLIYNIKVRNQLGGFENNFHHNIIDGVKNSHLKNDNIGQCLSFEPYNGSVYNNKIENNTLLNCEGAAIKIIATKNNDVNVSNNIFSNNYIENCGMNEAEIYISKYRNVKKQIFKNNHLSRGTVNYKGRIIKEKEFKNINKNSQFMEQIKEIGAGNINLIGSTIEY